MKYSANESLFQLTRSLLIPPVVPTTANPVAWLVSSQIYAEQTSTCSIMQSLYKENSQSSSPA